MNGERWLRWSLPALLLFLLVFGWHELVAPRAVSGVRVFGGPTVGGNHVSWRIEVAGDDGMATRALANVSLGVSVLNSLAPDATVVARWSGTTDAEGMAWVEADVSSPLDASLPLALELDWESRRVRLSLTPPNGAAWPRIERFAELPGTTSGELRLRVLSAFTVFAVPFAQRVDVRVMRDGEPVPAVVKAELEGRGRLERIVAEGAPGLPDSTARFELAPGEHTVALRLEATAAGEPLRGAWYGRLPIVPGAHFVRRVDERTLRVASPVHAERAYLAVVGEQRRRYGTSLPLTDDGHGGGHADVHLPFALGTEPLWAVVSSEPEFDSAAALGWPISDTWVRPAPVRKAPEILLADSLTSERQGERQRQRTMQHRLLLAAFAGGGIVVLGFVAAVRRSRRRLAELLAAAPEFAAVPVVEGQRPRFVLFALLLISSFVLLGIWLWAYWLPE